MNRHRAFAPATLGNFAAGFDLLGAALAPLDGTRLGDVVELGPAARSEFRVEGPYASAMAQETRPNLVLRTVELFEEALPPTARKGMPLGIVLEKNLPLSSGMGSSASSIVATLVALQALHGDPLSPRELLGLALRAEGLYSGGAHLDNVAPALRGGLQLAVPGPEGSVDCRALPWPGDLPLVLVHPHLQLATSLSRAALPEKLPLGRGVEFAGNLAALVFALQAGDRGLLGRCLRDPLAEVHRAPLVPGFPAAQRAARAAGALGCTLSGSGPSVFAIAESREVAPTILAALRQAFAEVDLASEGWICGLDVQGARLLP